MLLFQYGVYDWGEGKNLEIEFTRQLINGDEVIQINISFKYKFKEEYSNIKSMTNWYSPETSLDEWKQNILNDEIVNMVKTMTIDSFEIWIDNAE